MLSPKINLFSISSLIQFIFDRMNISSQIMKYIGMTNKFGVSDVCYLINLKFLAFGGLGEIFNNSLATENPSFRKLIF